MTRTRTLSVEEDGEVLLTLKLADDAVVYLDGQRVGQTPEQYHSKQEDRGSQ